MLTLTQFVKHCSTEYNIYVFHLSKFDHFSNPKLVDKDERQTSKNTNTSCAQIVKYKNTPGKKRGVIVLIKCIID